MARIIVVDDSKLMRHIVRHFLEEAGHDVDEWAEVSASEIPGRLEAAPPDLLITDYQMPGCNGLTVAKMARKARPALPIIVLTASHDPAVEAALHKQEVSRILHKPLTGEELLEAVRPLL